MNEHSKTDSNLDSLTRNWIKARLAEKGLTFAGIARASGISLNCLRTCLYRAFPRAEVLLARALDLSPWEIWGDRYDPETHKPNRRNPWYGRKDNKSYKSTISYKRYQNKGGESNGKCKE